MPSSRKKLVLNTVSVSLGCSCCKKPKLTRSSKKTAHCSFSEYETAASFSPSSETPRYWGVDNDADQDATSSTAPVRGFGRIGEESLALNSPYYHGIIVRAFTEIWYGVFSVKPGVLLLLPRSCILVEATLNLRKILSRTQVSNVTNITALCASAVTAIKKLCRHRQLMSFSSPCQPSSSLSSSWSLGSCGIMILKLCSSSAIHDFRFFNSVCMAIVRKMVVGWKRNHCKFGRR
ncbi:hypothetical protein F3Y22_tig00111378pilonHSYRG00008 [Hibiscus syriacus]|uniref:Uncharacterized protein n=1 Tax=Hibiscus syriacus TaxID=106335 RepID=A0A6A2YMI0_HIBSY|nr:hypothetical protein F3Y22_tig00111378pilonHSYRG00008 [Hibiscus syriacus]